MRRSLHKGLLLLFCSKILRAALIGMIAGVAVPALGQEATCSFGQRGMEKLNDYRLRNTSPKLQWAIGDVKKNHYDPALQAMADRNFTRSVRADLAFILNWWPNHHPTLQALIRYDMEGGKQHDLPSTECYLALAKAFAPDDIAVLLMEGYYYWHSGKLDKAIMSYEQAVDVNPDSADAHYNLALVYLQNSRYELAVDHAQLAYAAGYPLPGLRTKLEKLGYALSAKP